MKKHLNKVCGCYRHMRKIFFIFRLTALSLFLGLTGVYASANYSQNTNSEVQAQKKSIKGTVKDEKGQTIPGVSVVVKGTTTGQVTDIDGKYSLEVPVDAKTLVFSFVGMDKQEINISGRDQINVNLKETVMGLGEVVVVGYGTQKKVDLTGSVSTVSVKDFENAPVANAVEAMQGKVPGVQITSNSGAPGVDKEIRIRGVQSWGASNSPLYVVDGVIMDNMNSLSPNDIETISVLKDAASCAIYGSRAANGVVLVTTKRGSKSGAPVISFHSYTGVSVNSDIFPKFLNSSQWIQLDRESYMNAGAASFNQSPYGSQNPVDWSIFTAPTGKGMQVNLPAVDYNGVHANAISGYLYNTNWLKTLSQTGRIQNYDVSVSGGNDRSTYFTSATYFKQEGQILGSSADRISFRFNSDHKITDFIEFGNSVNIYSTSRTGVENTNVYLGAARQNPLSRPYELDANGNTTGYGYVRSYTMEGGNMTPLILAKEYSDDTRRYGFVGNVFLKVKILDGLTFTPRLSVDYLSSNRTQFSPEIHLTGIEGKSINSVGKTQSYNFHWITDYMLNYEKTFNKVHNVSASAIYSQEENKNEYLYGTRNGTPNNQIRYLNAGLLDGQNTTNGYTDWSFVSYIGRIGYNYNGKYYVQGSVRRDGTSRFVGDNKWGVFPSLSTGWRISKEKFFAPLADVINDLKIRASVGVLGNSNVGLYPTYATLTKQSYPMGAENSQIAMPTYSLTEAVNQNIKWESTLKKDIGFDANFFNSKVTLTADYYLSNTTNLLYGRPIPFAAGKSSNDPSHFGQASSPTINGGEVQNHGLEFSLGYQDKKGDFTYGINANLTAARNKVLNLDGRDIKESGLQVGQPLFRWYGYTSNGIVKDQATLDAHPYLTNPKNVHPIGLGDIWTVDVNGRDANGKLTGKPDGKIDADDRGFIGNKYPDFTYGLSANFGWKRWSIQVVGYGVQGQDLSTLQDGNGYFQYTSNDVVRSLDRWNATLNPNGNMPKVTKNDAAQNITLSSGTNIASFWLSDASFFKISNVNLKYSVPEKICQKIRLKGLDVYGSVENLHTFTKYPGGEVDITDDFGQVNQTITSKQWSQPSTKVPQPRTWVLGIKATF